MAKWTSGTHSFLMEVCGLVAALSPFLCLVTLVNPQSERSVLFHPMCLEHFAYKGNPVLGNASADAWSLLLPHPPVSRP